jgi:hypothetical protein
MPLAGPARPTCGAPTCRARARYRRTVLNPFAPCLAEGCESRIGALAGDPLLYLVDPILPVLTEDRSPEEAHGPESCQRTCPFFWRGMGNVAPSFLHTAKLFSPLTREEEGCLPLER